MQFVGTTIVMTPGTAAALRAVGAGVVALNISRIGRVAGEEGTVGDGSRLALQIRAGAICLGIARTGALLSRANGSGGIVTASTTAVADAVVSATGRALVGALVVGVLAIGGGATKAIRKPSIGLGAGLAGRCAARFTALAVDAIAGGAFGRSVAHIPLMFFVGTFVAVTPGSG